MSRGSKKTKKVATPEVSKKEPLELPLKEEEKLSFAKVCCRCTQECKQLPIFTVIRCPFYIRKKVEEKPVNESEPN